MSNYEHLSIDLKSILLTTYDRSQVIDIKPLCIEINVYEDMFSPGVSIDIVLEDAKGLIERFPIVGDERIGLSFRTPSLDDYIEVEFDIYKISPIAKTGERRREYALFGIAPEARINLLKEVNNAYKGSCKEIIDKVHETYFATGDAFPVPKTVVSSESLGTHHFVGVGETPFSFIKKVANEAQSSTYPASNFLFYETLDREYIFKTIDEMIDSDAVEDYYLADGGAVRRNNKSEKDTIHDYQIILDLSVDESVDTLKNAALGGYKNVVQRLDPVTKTYSQQVFEYAEEDQLKMLGDHKLIPDISLFREIEADVHTRFIRGTVYDETNGGCFVNTNISELSDPQYYYYRRRDRFAHLDVASRQLLDTLKLQVTISGASDLHVGQVVNIFVPQDSNDEEFSKIYNLFYGGDTSGADGKRKAKFLVTALKHKIRYEDNTYVTQFECVKNSYASEIKTEQARMSDG